MTENLPRPQIPIDLSYLPPRNAHTIIGTYGLLIDRAGVYGAHMHTMFEHAAKQFGEERGPFYKLIQEGLSATDQKHEEDQRQRDIYGFLVKNYTAFGQPVPDMPRPPERRKKEYPKREDFQNITLEARVAPAPVRRGLVRRIVEYFSSGP